MRRIMQLVVDSDDQELAYFTPGGWWVESEKVNTAACIGLLRLCLIRSIWETAGTTYYQLTPEAFETFKNPEYIPIIVREMRKRS